MKLGDLAAVVERNDRGKRDIDVKSAELRVNEAGELVVGGSPMAPNDWGWYSILNKASKGTTARYMFRHPTDQWVPLVNQDLERSDQAWVLRTRGDRILGVVTDSYQKFDNREVIPSLIDNLGADTPVHRFHLDDRFFFVRCLYPDGDFRIDMGGEGVYHVGFTAYNSEVGFRSLGTAAFLYKLACQNDAQFVPNAVMSFRHVGHDRETMSGGLRQAISAGKGLKNHYTSLVRKAAEEVIEGPAVKAALDEVRKILRLSRKRIDEIAALYAQENQTKMGMVNSITHFAHRLRGEERYFMEAGAGSLLETALPVAQAA